MWRWCSIECVVRKPSSWWTTTNGHKGRTRVRNLFRPWCSIVGTTFSFDDNGEGSFSHNSNLIQQPPINFHPFPNYLHVFRPSYIFQCFIASTKKIEWAKVFIRIQKVTIDCQWSWPWILMVTSRVVII